LRHDFGASYQTDGQRFTNAKADGLHRFTAASLLLIVSINLKNPVSAMIAMGFASFANDLVMPGSWGACMDVGGSMRARFRER
jgi:hypothetical protein